MRSLEAIQHDIDLTDRELAALPARREEIRRSTILDADTSFSQLRTIFFHITFGATGAFTFYLLASAVLFVQSWIALVVIAAIGDLVGVVLSQKLIRWMREDALSTAKKNKLTHLEAEEFLVKKKRDALEEELERSQHALELQRARHAGQLSVATTSGVEGALTSVAPSDHDED